uniref:Deleted in malignant brain tumors 1 protein n=1 Tax=Malurus cyaneus samueli TaxID=2593467 RepID=A0A8C5U5Z5_9PASS
MFWGACEGTSLWGCGRASLVGPCSSLMDSGDGIRILCPCWALLTSSGSPSCGALLQGFGNKAEVRTGPCCGGYRAWLPGPEVPAAFSADGSSSPCRLEDSSCLYDTIEVYDGGPSQGWSLGFVCRNDHRVFNSSGNELTVLFRSDGSVTGRGFHAYYSSFPAFNNYSCGGLLSSSSGSLQSPFYPSNYPNNVNCVWEIQVKNNFLHFTKQLCFLLRMEGGQCLSDYVEIYDGPVHTSPLLGKICSGYYHSYISSSNLLTVLFHSNSRYTYRGFQAYYYSSPADDNTALLCLPDYMHVVVSRYFLQSHGYSAWNLTLSDPFCTPNITSQHVTFDIPYTQCGTVRQVNNNTITYSNVIRGFSSGTLPSRNKNLRLHVNCKMLQNTWAQLMYVANDNLEEINETQYGRYDVNLTFYNSSNFLWPVYDSPYYVSINQSLFLEAQLHSSDPNLVLFLRTCLASPSSHNSTGAHAIIKDGCVRDPTYATYYSPYRHILRFKFNAFQSFGSSPLVYLQCELVVCRAYDYSSRCYQGCVKRSKREASSDSESVIVIAGPIQLWEPEYPDLEGIHRDC